MGGRRWTDKEIKFMQDSWGMLQIGTIAEKVGRTPKAVVEKAYKLGMESPYNAKERLTAADVARILKIKSHTVVRWVHKHGLKASKRTYYQKTIWQIDLNDLIKWLKNNQNRFDSRKIDLYALCDEPDWLKEKRKADAYKPIKKYDIWTADDTKRLMDYCAMGKSLNYIAKMLNRSTQSISLKTHQLKQKGMMPRYRVRCDWTEKEETMMLDMEKQGLTDREIAWELGRDEKHIVNHRFIMRKNGLYEGLKEGYKKEVAI